YPPVSLYPATPPTETYTLSLHDALPILREVGQLVLRLAGDAELLGGEGRVLAHRQPGARLGVARDLDADHARAQLADQLGALLAGAGAVDLEHPLAHRLADADRGVGGGVGAAADARLDAAERDGVGHGHDRLQARTAGELQVVGGGVGRQAAAEHALADQAVLADALEHRAADDHAEPLALEVEAAHQAVQGGGEHVLIGRLRVGPVGASERDAVAAHDGDRTRGLRCAGAGFGHSTLQVSSVVHIAAGTGDPARKRLVGNECFVGCGGTARADWVRAARRG